MFPLIAPFPILEIPIPSPEERAEFQRASQDIMLGIYRTMGIGVGLAALVWWPTDPWAYGSWPQAYNAMRWLRMGLICWNAILITAQPFMLKNLRESWLRLLLMFLYAGVWEVWCWGHATILGQSVPSFFYVIPFFLIFMTLALYPALVHRGKIELGLGLCIVMELGWIGGCLSMTGQGIERMFPFLFVAPLFTIALLVSSGQRLFWTMAGTLVAGLSAYEMQLPFTMFGSAQLAYLIFTAMVSTAVGHIQYWLLMGFFVWRRRLAAKKAELEGLNLILEERVTEQAALLLELNRSAASTRLRERERIARDLHDGLGQDLTATRLVASAMMLGNPENAKGLGEVVSLLERSHQSLRQALHDLMPTSLEEHGLSVALRKMVEETSSRAGLRSTISLGVLPRDLSMALSVTLFRVAQESLSNVIKHAWATELEVRLEITSGMLLLEISDNGVGLPTIHQKEGGFGLVGIKNRVESVGGQLLLKSGPGTTVRAVIPVSS